MQAHADHFHDAVGAFDGLMLHRVHARARRLVSDRIIVDEEIERRLALIVLFACGAQIRTSAEPGADEGAIAQACVDRLMARTTAA